MADMNIIQFLGEPRNEITKMHERRRIDTINTDRDPFEKAFYTKYKIRNYKSV